MWVNRMESLEEKLLSLGVSLGLKQSQTGSILKNNRIEDVLPGEEFSTDFGSTFIFHKDYPPAYQHGIVPFDKNIPFKELVNCSNLDISPLPPISKIAFLDTETSGLSGGTGTIVFLVGIGAFSDTGFRMTQIFLRSPAEEKSFLSALEHIIAPYELMITYNGKSFDVPLLNTRYLLNYFPSPFGSIKHLDLLHLSRKVWKIRLSSRSLSALESDILLFKRTSEEIPGWMVPQIYFDYLRDGDAHPLAGVFYHNAEDILSLTALFHHLSDMVRAPCDRIENNLDLISIAGILEKKGDFDQAILLYKEAIIRGIPQYFTHWVLFRLASIYKRILDWDTACKFWTQAAEEGHLDSCLELAKYFEHQSQNIPQAIGWCQKAIIIQQQVAPATFHRSISTQPQLIHRLERLQTKLVNVKGKKSHEIS